jgi:hypothetical protein
MGVWREFYKNNNLSVRAWKDYISLIRTVDGEDAEIIISTSDLIDIYINREMLETDSNWVEGESNV